MEYKINSVGNFKIGSFATGAYINACKVCGREFLGDKLARQCLGCVIEVYDDMIAILAEMNIGEIVDKAAAYKKMIEEEATQKIVKGFTIIQSMTPETLRNKTDYGEPLKDEPDNFKEKTHGLK